MSSSYEMRLTVLFVGFCETRVELKNTLMQSTTLEIPAQTTDAFCDNSGNIRPIIIPLVYFGIRFLKI